VFAAACAGFGFAPAAAPRDLTIVPLVRLAPYRYWGPSGYAASVRAFGAPSSRRVVAGRPQTSNLCGVRWRSLGLEMGFASGPYPCRASSLAHGAWYGAEISSPRWRTDRGLRVGDPVARVRVRYPRASRHGASWWLATKEDHLTPGKREASLVAVASGGRIVRFVVPPGYTY
jgi:hypothetical protein